MDYHQLEAFHMVAKEKSFIRAAESLHITQSALSTRIANLEAQIEADLFVRNGRTITLTKYGEAFEPYVRQIIALAKDAAGKLDQLKKMDRSCFEIATTNSFISNYILPKLLCEFQKAIPDIRINIEPATPNKIVRQLQSGQLHIGLVNFIPTKQMFTKLPLIKSEMILVSSPEYPLYLHYIKEQRFSWDWLEGVPIIHFHNESKYFRALMNLLKQNMVNTQQITINNDETIKRMASEKLGVAFLPRMVVQDELNRGDLAEIPIGSKELFTFEIYLVYNQQQYTNYAVDEFISIAQKFYKQAAPGSA